MNVEDLLAEAMERQVSHVQAPPTLGRTVRRRHRAHVMRFRVAGAALVTAAVAVAVPPALNTGGAVPAAPAGSPTSGQDTAVVDSVTMPDVTGMKIADAVAAVRAAGLGLDGAEPFSPGSADEIVVTQKPAAGAEVARGSLVALTSLPPISRPQDLGDLGDGRTFGGIHVGYLPEGLAWSRWSGKNGFGKTSYATSYAPDGGDDSRGYGVQIVVYKGEAAKRVRSRMDTLPSVAIGDREGYLANLTDGGEVVKEPRDDATATIGFLVSDEMAVEVCISPKYAKQVDAMAELKKIAEGIEPIR
ncbi:PASTA domain-containing protein [Nonomuraea rhodomycinica]|uniref:PASTA domain-containing protein n=1 Tax=Nonomuraea rhodomycinica TaxID=1712872 RepID=A0A7Y6IWM7_9ACTN|nr:PASTA domain-containing protein [Nonomuraea rhodomycinica]NUW45700.1 PASTA domain-containing protein [Nonomuraea rhodomycinica]